MRMVLALANALCLAAAAQTPSPEQQAARSALEQMEYRYTVDDFFRAGFDRSPAVALFLKAGMTADTPAPSTGESLLMAVLPKEECDDAAVLTVMEPLLQGGADPNQWYEGGVRHRATPLLRAYPCLDRMERLFAAGARLDVRGIDQWGRTKVGDDLLGLAIEDDSPQVVSLLIAKGYDVKPQGAHWLKEAAGKTEIQRILRAAGAKTTTAAAPPKKKK